MASSVSEEEEAQSFLRLPPFRRFLFVGQQSSWISLNNELLTHEFCTWKFHYSPFPKVAQRAQHDTGRKKVHWVGHGGSVGSSQFVI